MNILITNDDGFGANGIESLKKALSKKHKIFYVAPEGNRSGASLKITLDEPVRLTKVSDREYKCSGYPADCVATAIKSDLFNEKIDLVISGINHGSNLGTDVVYSGTCGAAKQATLMGVPAIAVSMSLKDPEADWFDMNNWDFDSLAEFVAKNVEELYKMVNPANSDTTMPENPSTYLNINAFSPYEGKGIKETVPCFFDHKFDTTIEDGKASMPPIYWGINSHDAEGRGYCDFDACQEGFVSISLLHAEPVSVPVNISGLSL